MNDLYIKRNKLCFDSMRLRILKWSFDNYQYKDKMGGRLASRKEGEKLEC